jgi:hypothetical protein
LPVSDDTILRHLKRQVARIRAKTPVRVNVASGSRANENADNDDRDGPPRRRSRDRVDDLANRRRFAMHQAARVGVTTRLAPRRTLSWTKRER